MATTVFSAGTVIATAWLNDVDAMTYDQTVSVPWKTITWTNTPITHSGAHTWSGNQVYNGATTFNGTLAGNIVSGIYTPTLTNNANITTSTASVNTTYIRVGSIVSVAGTVALTPTANSVATTLYLTLPISSALTSATQLAGTATRTGGGLVNLSAIVLGEITGDQASLTFLNDTDSGTSRTWAFQFQYVIA